MKSWITKILGDSLIYGLTPLLSKAMSFFLLPIYTRYLSVDEYGLLAIFLAIAVITSTISTHGMGSGVFKFHTYKVNSSLSIKSKIVSSYNSTALIATLIFSFLLLLFLYTTKGFLVEFFFGDLYLINELTIILVYSFLSSNLTVHFAILRAERNKNKVLALNLIRMIVSISITLLMLIYYEQGLLGYLIGLASGELALLIVLSPVIAKYSRNGFFINEYIELLKYSISFVPHRLMGILMIYVGIYIIKLNIGSFELGLYSIAEKIVLPIMLIVGSIQTSWVPIKFEILATEKNPFQVISRIASIYLIILVLIYSSITFWGEFLLPILVSKEFFGAYLYIPFIALVHIANAIYFIYSSAIEAGKSTYLLPLASFSGLFLTSISSYIFIPLFGASAAALSLSFGWFIMAFVVNLISKRQIRIEPKYLLIFILTIIFSMLFKSSFPGDYFYSIIGSILILIILGIFLRKDLKYLKKVVYEKKIESY